MVCLLQARTSASEIRASTAASASLYRTRLLVSVRLDLPDITAHAVILWFFIIYIFRSPLYCSWLNITAVVCSVYVLQLSGLLWKCHGIAYTVVKGDQLSLWIMAKLGVSELWKPWNDCRKIWHKVVRRRYHQACRNSKRSPQGAFWQIGKILLLHGF